MIVDSKSLETLRAGRPFYSWLSRIGFAREIVSRLKKGVMDISERNALALCLFENANLEWLKTGLGKPFDVIDLVDEVDAGNAASPLGYVLRMLLDFEEQDLNINAYVVTDGMNEVLVLVTTNFIARPIGEDMPYTHIEVMRGIDDDVKGAVSDQAMLFSHLVTDMETFKKLDSGYMGTFELTGEDGRSGLLEASRPMSMAERLHVSGKAKRVELNTQAPWLTPPLDEWAICGMNHYHIAGQKKLFVSMTKDKQCITAEGDDTQAIWKDLAAQATSIC